MGEPILCLVALAFLAWVVILKAESQGLKEDNRKLKELLSHHVKDIQSEVRTSGAWRTPMAHIDGRTTAASPGR